VYAENTYPQSPPAAGLPCWTLRLFSDFFPLSYILWFLSLTLFLKFDVVRF